MGLPAGVGWATGARLAVVALSTESSVVAARFFRQGKAGSGHTALTPAQVNRMVRDHGAWMGRLGYWPPAEPYDLTVA